MALVGAVLLIALTAAPSLVADAAPKTLTGERYEEPVLTLLPTTLGIRLILVQSIESHFCC